MVIGAESYTMIWKALSERLAAAQAQKDLAASTDFFGSSSRMRTLLCANETSPGLPTAGRA
jgi:hypothetical protein